MDEYRNVPDCTMPMFVPQGESSYLSPWEALLLPLPLQPKADFPEQTRNGEGFIMIKVIVGNGKHHIYINMFIQEYKRVDTLSMLERLF